MKNLHQVMKRNPLVKEKDFDEMIIMLMMIAIFFVFRKFIYVLLYLSELCLKEFSHSLQFVYPGCKERCHFQEIGSSSAPPFVAISIRSSHGLKLQNQRSVSLSIVLLFVAFLRHFQSFLLIF